MSAKVVNLQLPHIRTDVSRSSTTYLNKESLSKPLPSISILTSEQNTVFDSPKSKCSKRHLERHPPISYTVKSFTRTRPLGLLPNSFHKMKTWKELGLLVNKEEYSSTLKATSQESKAVKFQINLPDGHKVQPSTENTNETFTKQNMHRILLPDTAFNSYVKESCHTEDEEYLDMIAQINMSMYNDDEKHDRPHMMLNSDMHQYVSSQLESRSKRKSPKLKRPKPFQNEGNLEYLTFIGQSQLNERFRSSDIRDSSKHEPCERCRLRGTRCNHCIAIRTGGGYIILDTNNGLIESKVNTENKKEAWRYSHGNDGLMSSMQLSNRNRKKDDSRNTFSDHLLLAEHDSKEFVRTKPGFRKILSDKHTSSTAEQGFNEIKYSSKPNYLKVHPSHDQVYDGDVQLSDTGFKSSLSSKIRNDAGKHVQHDNSRVSSSDFTHRQDISGTRGLDDDNHEKQGMNGSHDGSIKLPGRSSRVGSSRPRSSLRHGIPFSSDSNDKVTKNFQSTSHDKEVVKAQIIKQRKKIKEYDSDSENEDIIVKDRNRKKSARPITGHEKDGSPAKQYQKVLSGKYSQNNQEEEKKDRQFGDLMKFNSKRNDNVKIKDCSLQELKGIDPLDYLAKYCIIDQKKVPHYQQVFDNVDRDEDSLITIPELDFALKAVNYNLISDSEMHYINNILELAGRYALNFQLFSLVAALSEKVVALDDMTKRLINSMDFEALETKMKKCKELFYLLANDKEGLVTTRDLSVELQAGGLTVEHVDFVTDRLNYEGRGTVQFLDYLTYVPLFVEIHDNINDNPLDFSRNK